MTTRFDVERAVLASDLAAPARQIMLTLAVYTDARTAAVPAQHTPSITDLEKVTGLGRSTITRHLKALESSGWLCRQRPATNQALGEYEKTRYRLTVPPSAAAGRPPSAAAGLGLVPERALPSAAAGLSNKQELKQLPNSDGATVIFEPRRFVMEATQATPSEADVIVKRLLTNFAPDNPIAYFRVQAQQGRLRQLLQEQRAAVRQADVDAAVKELRRRGPMCKHGDLGGESLHPTHGTPLCPSCRTVAGIRRLNGSARGRTP